MHYNEMNKKRNDMKEQILEISDKLRDNKITDKEAQTELCFLFGVMRCYVKEIDQFYNDTGYCDNTNQFGIRKDYKKGEGWDWKNPSQMIKDWMKWKRNNA